MRLIESAFAIAKTQLGVKETPGLGDTVKVVEYHKSCEANPEIITHDSVAWCSAFVNWCVQKAGGRGTRNRAARSWLAWGREGKGEEGDIVVFKRGNSGWEGHVAFVVSVGTLYVECLGGNQSDSVCISKYPKWKVLGYRTSLD